LPFAAIPGGNPKMDSTAFWFLHRMFVDSTWLNDNEIKFTAGIQVRFGYCIPFATRSITTRDGDTLSLTLSAIGPTAID
jgi:hypothetical protein